MSRTTIPQVKLVQLASECVSQHTKKRASLPALPNDIATLDEKQ
nr:MAG TPA: hypothetical protein [Caudoviricetes sp.]